MACEQVYSVPFGYDNDAAIRQVPSFAKFWDQCALHWPQPHWLPENVAIYEDAKAFLTSDAASGTHARRYESPETMRYWFSDAKTALIFKLRFG